MLWLCCLGTPVPLATFSTGMKIRFDALISGLLGESLPFGSWRQNDGDCKLLHAIFCSSVGPRRSPMEHLFLVGAFKKETEVTDCYRCRSSVFLNATCILQLSSWRPIPVVCSCLNFHFWKSQSQDRRECFPSALFFQERSRRDLWSWNARARKHYCSCTTLEWDFGIWASQNGGKLF